MTWATRHIVTLQGGRPATFKPKGNSMEPIIKSGQEVTVSPSELPLKVGDIVLCRVQGSEFLHLIKAMRKIKDKGQFQIGNAQGHINGWTDRSKIYGVLTHVDGEPVSNQPEATAAA